jgi:hypothetical protein
MIPKAVERGAGRIAKTGSRPTWSQGILAGSLQVVHTKCGERRPRCSHIAMPVRLATSGGAEQIGAHGRSG